MAKRLAKIMTCRYSKILRLGCHKLLLAIWWGKWRNTLLLNVYKTGKYDKVTKSHLKLQLKFNIFQAHDTGQTLDTWCMTRLTHAKTNSFCIFFPDLIVLICRVSCLYVSVTNTKGFATLAAQHILAIYCCLFFSFLMNAISVNTVKVVSFENSTTIKILNQRRDVWPQNTILPRALNIFLIVAYIWSPPRQHYKKYEN